MESGGLRQVAFDLSRACSRFASRQLLEELRPEDIHKSCALDISDNSEVLLLPLPDAMTERLRGFTGISRCLSDICIDKGRRPYAWVDGCRVFLLRRVGGNDSEGSDSSSGSSRVVEPTFDAIYEHEHGRLHCCMEDWRVVKDVVGAVDAIILKGRQYPV